MSGLDEGRNGRRADAQRNATAILDAAIALLARTPDASMDDIATAAAVTRQTVYAHFRSRQALLDAVADRVTSHVIVALDAVDVDEGSAAAALLRWIDVAWSLLQRYPVLLTSAMPATAPREQIDRHTPIIGGLSAIIRRGQRSKEFDPSQPLDWIIAATIALGHAAAEQVANERMTANQAGEIFARSLLRVCESSEARSRGR